MRRSRWAAWFLIAGTLAALVLSASYVEPWSPGQTAFAGGEADTDGDGCTDSQEAGPTPSFGGDRNSLDRYDFFDVTGDRAIDLSDTLAVLGKFGSVPPNPPYDPLYDRYIPNSAKPYLTAAAVGDSLGIDLQDALVNLQSFGHSCAPDCTAGGGPMTNGATHCGAIRNPGETDIWSFTATEGDHIGVHIGEMTDTNGFVPWIKVIAPGGTSLGSSSGAWDTAAAQLDVFAPATGAYNVLVASNDSGLDGAGTYRLTMAHTPGPITISPNDEGGSLTNGATHTGEILTGDLDVWTFTATAGDRIAAEVGEVTDTNAQFTPWIRIWSPTGASLGSNWDSAAAPLEAAAPSTGRYLVLVASNDSGNNGTGTYRLTMTRTPGPVTVSPGDEGGSLTNGAMHTGAIPTGDLDVWTFTATAGDRIAAEVGEVTDTNAQFTPWIRIWSPTGASLGSNWDSAAAPLEAAAPSTGTYLVLVASNDSGNDGTGTYRLTMTRTPGPVTVSPGDQGGPITLGAAHAGEIVVGDLDVWTISAVAGEHITAQISETVDTTGEFTPWVRVWSPTGASLGSDWGASSAAITNVIASTTGTYLVLVASNDSGNNGTGSYQLTVTKP